MIRPLPDKAAHQPRILVEEINVLLEGSRTVAHGVGILAQDKRLVPVSVLCVGFGVAERGVHPAEDVGGLGIPVAFVVDQAALVDALDELVHGRVVAPVAGFVAERPEDDAGPVEVAHDHLPRPVDVCLLPVGVVGCECEAVASNDKQPMALEVAEQATSVIYGTCTSSNVSRGKQHLPLIQDPQSQLVGKLVKPGVVDVMRGPDGIDVVLLHEHQVGPEELVRDCPSVVGMVFVSVDAPQLDGAAVDAKDAVDELRPAEAYPLGQRAARHGEHQLVEVGGLGGPFVRVLDGNVKAERPPACLGRVGNLGPIRIQEAQSDGSPGVELEVNAQRRISVGIVQNGLHMEVLKVGCRELVQPDIAEDATEPPLVLQNK